VHLNLGDGAPVAEPGSVMSLLDGQGKFAGGPESLLLRRARRGLLLAEVEREWDAQIRKVREAGIRPTHLDGHKHVHMLPGLFEIALRLAKSHGIEAIRVSLEESSLRAALSSSGKHHPGVVIKQGVQARGLKLLARDAREQARRAGLATADYFCGIAQTGELTREGVELFLKRLPEGTTELMCHPVAPKRAGDPDRHPDSKSCRFSGDSPDRLWLRHSGSVKGSAEVFNEKRSAHPVLHCCSVL